MDQTNVEENMDQFRSCATILAAFLFALFLAFFSSVLPEELRTLTTRTPVFSGDLTPTDTPRPPFIVTVRPPQRMFPFGVENNVVRYRYTPTLNCQFVIAGNVTFLDENTDAAGYRVMIEMLLIEENQEQIPPFPMIIGGDPGYGETGWSVLISTNYWHYVWVEDLRSGEQLSDKILINELDCDNTLAIVNFVQRKPLD